jgi:hypothetical protein
MLLLKEFYKYLIKFLIRDGDAVIVEIKKSTNVES